MLMFQLVETMKKGCKLDSIPERLAEGHIRRVKKFQSLVLGSTGPHDV